MNAIILILVIVLSLAVSALTMLFVVIAGIQSEERRMNLSGAPRTRTEKATRRVVGLRVSQPDAIRVFAAVHTSRPASAAACISPSPSPRASAREGAAPSATPTTAAVTGQPARANTLVAS